MKQKVIIGLVILIVIGILISGAYSGGPQMKTVHWKAQVVQPLPPIYYCPPPSPIPLRRTPGCVEQILLLPVRVLKSVTYIVFGR